MTTKKKEKREIRIRFQFQAGGKKTESKPQHKERLRRRAQQLFPRDSLWEAGLGVQRSVCDAILIAYYATGKSIDE